MHQELPAKRLARRAIREDPGLSNSRGRLERRFGHDASLVLRDNLGGGAVAELTDPFRHLGAVASRSAPVAKSPLSSAARIVISAVTTASAEVNSGTPRSP